MNVLGIGIDATDIPRIGSAFERYGERFLRRVFTDGEIAYCTQRRNPVPHLAGRFAAKEALLKALAVPEGLSWHELEVVREPGAPPRLELSGEAARAAERKGATRVHLSLTHAGGQAAAMVVLEG